MQKLRKLAGAMVLLLLAGCGATPVGFEKLPDLKFGEAGLYVYRADRDRGRAPTFRILVDDTEIGSLPNDGYLSLVVPSGARTVQAGLGDGGIFSRETVIKTTLVVDDQNHYFLQIVPASSSGETSSRSKAYFTLTPEFTAVAELEALRRAR